MAQHLRYQLVMNAPPFGPVVIDHAPTQPVSIPWSAVVSRLESATADLIQLRDEYDLLDARLAESEHRAQQQYQQSRELRTMIALERDEAIKAWSRAEQGRRDMAEALAEARDWNRRHQAELAQVLGELAAALRAKDHAQLQALFDASPTIQELIG